MAKQQKADLSVVVKRAAGGGRPGPDRVPGSRPGQVGIVLRVEPGVRRALRQLALDEDTSLQALGVEALMRLLEERRRA